MSIEKNKKLVSIVIPVYNCSVNFKETIEKILQQSYQGDIEVIVVDNNSQDNSDKIVLSYEQVSLLYQKEKQNRAATRNLGISVAKGDILAFIDGDCIPDQGWLEQALKIMEQEDLDIVGGNIVVTPLSSESPIFSIIDALCFYDPQRIILKNNGIMTTSVFIKKEVFNTIGLFEEDLPDLEDLSFGVRAFNFGFSLGYADLSVITHSPRKTFLDIWKKSIRNGKGGFFLCNKNLKWAGKYGWRHPFRVFKYLLKLPHFSWNSLCFPPQEISLFKKILIVTIAFFSINIPSSFSYFKCWITINILKMDVDKNI